MNGSANLVISAAVVAVVTMAPVPFDASIGSIKFVEDMVQAVWAVWAKSDSWNALKEAKYEKLARLIHSLFSVTTALRVALGKDNRSHWRLDSLISTLSAVLYSSTIVEY